MHKLFLILAASLLSVLSPSLAQGLFTKTISSRDTATLQKTLQLNGQLGSSIYAGGKANDFNLIRAEFNLKATYQKNNGFLLAETRLQKGIAWNEAISTLDLREAFIGYKTRRFTGKIGNQIVQWGKADGFNPTNNLNPQDYFYLSSNPDEGKLPNFMVTSKYQLNPEWEVEFIGIPIYKPSIYRYDLILQDENIHFSGHTFDKNTFGKGTFAVKLNANLPSSSFSFSIFNGYDPFTGYRVDTVLWTSSVPQVNFIISPYRKIALGADLEMPFQNMIFRVETALNLTTGYENSIHIPAPGASYVFNVETSLGGWNSIFQYVGNYIPDFKEISVPALENQFDPAMQISYAEEMIRYNAQLFNRKLFNTQKQFGHAVSAHFQRSLFYERMEFSMSCYYNFISKDRLIKPSLKWSAGDAFWLTTGWTYMKGEEGELFGYTGSLLSCGFLEIKIAF